MSVIELQPPAEAEATSRGWRPLVLRMVGLRGYVKETVIDFTTMRLAAITGPTGAGKSSILEALTFAMYGSATWSGSSVQPLISDNQPRMTVSVTFLAAGQEWQVTRSSSRSGAGGHELRCLSDPTVPVIDNARAVTAKIQQDLIGLDVEGFQSCVLLVQNKFDRLLKAPRGEKAEALKGVFDLRPVDRVRENANEFVKAAQARLVKLAQQRGQFLPDPGATAADALAVIAEHAPYLDVLTSTQTKVEQLRDAAVTHEQAQERAEAGQRSLATLIDTEQPDRLAALVELDAKLGAAKRDAGAALTVAHRRAKSAARWRQNRAADKTDDAGLSVLHSRLRSMKQERASLLGERDNLVSRWDRDVTGAAAEAVNKVSAALADAKRDAATAESDLAARQDAATTAARIAQEARASIEAARAASVAHLASHGHAPGDACPVCTQTLPESWVSPEATADLDALAADAERAEQASRAAANTASQAGNAHENRGRALAEAQRAVATAVAVHELLSAGLPEGATTLETEPAVRLARSVQSEQARLSRRLAELETALGELPSWLPGTGPRDDEWLADTLAYVERERTRLSDLSRKAEAWVQAVAPAQQALADADRAYDRRVHAPMLQEHGAIKRLLTEVANLTDRHDADAPPKDPTATELHAWGVAAHGEATRALETLTTTASRAREALSAARAEGVGLLKAEGFSKLTELQEAHRNVYARVVNARSQLEQAEAQVEPAADLDSLIKQIEAAIAEHAEVAHQLGTRQFMGALIEQRQRALLAIASGILGDITGGEFGFTEQFTMIVRASGVERAPETLSGGETFLASIALALALVELAGRSGGRLDALFIDEGFGSLSPAPLDQALSALAHRARAGRLIVLISHVPVLAEQLDRVVRIERTPSGSVIVDDALVAA